jgi:hypothetical protein
MFIGLSIRATTGCFRDPQALGCLKVTNRNL